MSEFASFAVKRARKYVSDTSKHYVHKKVKQAVQAVERKATETIKRAAEDIVDNVRTKRQRIMPRKGPIMANRGRSRSLFTQKKGRRRKFSRALRRRRSGYNVKSLKKVMRRIALDASQTKRHAFGHVLSPDTGDVQGLPLRVIQTTIYPITSNLRADVPSDVESWEGNHFFLKGIQVAGQVRNKDSATRLGIRVMVFKDEVSGFDYDKMNEDTSAQLLWYNRATGSGTRFVSLPEPYKRAPKLMKGQNAKMVWSQSFELDYKSSDTGESNTSDRATFKKYIPINREMYLKTKDSNRPQCQWWFCVTHYRLDMESDWNHASVDLTPSMCLTGTVYFKDP